MKVDYLIEILVVSCLLFSTITLGLVYYYLFKRIDKISKEFIDYIRGTNSKYSYQFNSEYMPIRQNVIEETIYSLENQYQIRLSYNARTLLITPIMDYYLEEPTNGERELFWRESLAIIIKAIADDYFDRTFSRYDNPRISSIDVLRAIQSKWCNIPPFCRRP